MSPSTLDDLGKLILRVTLGVLILLHGIAKLQHGVGPIESMMAARGLPAFLAWAVYLGEVLAPALVILGLYARLGGLLIAVNMVVAIVLVHSGQLLQMANGGWRLELQGMYLSAALAVALFGAGRFSLGGRGGQWN
ncbi:DoxX family protein [Alcaligenaceae bacterium]|nr:DoxX family protein [Alcaligenaceae bacterium]